MPSGKAKRGRPRSKNTRNLRSRANRNPVDSGKETPATESLSGGDAAEQAVATEAISHRGGLRGLQGVSRSSLGRMYSSKCACLLIFAFWIAVILGYFLSYGVSSAPYPSKYFPPNNENDDGQPLEKESVMEAVFNFFTPTTCIPAQKQVITPCKGDEPLNKSECIKYKCCYSENADFPCFVPLKDKATQMLRLLVFGLCSMLFLGFLPIYCSACCWRSKWANPLRKKVNRILKSCKQQRNRRRLETEMLPLVAEDENEDSDENEELAALLPQ